MRGTVRNHSHRRVVMAGLALCVLSPMMFPAVTARAAVPPGARLFSVTPATNSINRIDPTSGALLTSYPLPAGGTDLGHGLALSGDSLYYCSILSPTIYELNADTGALTDADAFIPNGSFDGLGVGQSTFGTTLFAMDYAQDRIYLLSPLIDTVVHSYQTSFDAIGGLDYCGSTGELYVSSSAGVMYALNPSTGAILRSVSTSAFRPGVAVVGDTLYLSDTSRNISQFSLTGTPLGSFTSPNGNATALAGDSIPEPSGPLVLAAAAILLTLRKTRFTPDSSRAAADAPGPQRGRRR